MYNITSMMGKNIKFFREKKRMTQKELAENICTQAMLSNIEQGKSSPTIIILYPLCKRLNVDVSQLIALSLNERSDYIDEVNQQLKITAINRDYLEMKHIILYEKKNPLSQFPNFKKILLWYEAIYLFYIEKKYENAFKILDEALHCGRISKEYTMTEMEILLTKANFLTDQKNYKEAIFLYQEVYTYFDLFNNNFDNNIVIKYCYNFSRALRLDGRIIESIKYGEKGIQHCIRSNSMYLLGDLYFMLGKNQIDQRNYSEGESALTFALHFYRVLHNSRMSEATQKEIDNIKISSY